MPQQNWVLLLKVEPKKMKKTLQISIEFPQVEMKHWLLSPRLFMLVKVLCPKNMNILVFGDQKQVFHFTLCPTNGPKNWAACCQLPIQARCIAMEKTFHVPSVPRYLCAVHISHHSQSKSFPTSLTNVYSCFTNEFPMKNRNYFILMSRFVSGSISFQ